MRRHRNWKIHSLSKVSLRLWCEGQREDEKFVSTVSSIMSGHCAAWSHLIRLRIFEETMYMCLKDYETEDHLMWHCERFETERCCLTSALTALDVPFRTLVQD
jgi:hypothetical protein